MRLMVPFVACLAISLSDLAESDVRAAAAGTAEARAEGSGTPHPAGEATYYFGASPARTKITFESKTNVTNILGYTNLCSGSVTVDFDAGTGRCHLVIPAASLNTGMDDRDRAMRGKVWLDVKTHPTIEFASKTAAFVQPSTWKVDGEFLFHGVKQDLSVEAEVKQVPPALGKKLGEGAWVRVKTEFKVDITKHGISIDKSAQFTVEPVWNVAIELFATTAKPADAPAPVVAAEEEEEIVRVVRVPKLKPDGLPGTIYEFGKKPQLTTLRATSKTQLETVVTQINASHGFVGIDRDKGLGAVRIHIPVAQLNTGEKTRDEKLRSDAWLDEAKHKMILFEGTKATKKSDKVWTVEGTFTLHGVAKPLALDVEVVEIPAEEIKKANWGEKPGLRVTGDFQIKLSDFGVKIPDISVGKVNDVLDVSIFLVGLLAD